MANHFFDPEEPNLGSVVTKEAIGKRIAKRRKKMGLTQQQLAEKLYCNRSTLANYESGAKLPSDPADIQKIVDALETDYNYLFGGSEGEIPFSAAAYDKLANDDLIDTYWDAINFFLSQDKGLDVIASLYLYLTSDIEKAYIEGSKRKIDPKKIYFVTGEDIADQITFAFSPAEYDSMILLSEFQRLKEWKKELQKKSASDAVEEE